MTASMVPRLTLVVVVLSGIARGGEAQVATPLDAASVRLVPLPGWVRANVGDRVLFAPPEAPAADRAVLSVEPSVDVAVDFDTWFEGAWRSFVREHRRLEVSAPTVAATAQAGHELRLMSGSVEDGVGGYIYFLYFAARQQSRVQPIVFASRDNALFNRYLEPVAILLQTAVTFLPPDRQPLSATDLSTAMDLFPAGPVPVGGEPPPAPMRSGRVWGTPGSPIGPAVPGALDGIYTGLATGLSMGGVVTDRGVSRMYVTFYPDGRLYRRIPEGGLEGFHRDSAEWATPELWGRFRAVGPGRWEIRWNGQQQVEWVTREGEGLRYEGATVIPVLSCGELEGAFSLANADGESTWSVTFTRAGEFYDDSLIGAVAYENLMMPNPRTIDAGSGRYRLGRNTLYLDYDDGRRVIVAMYCDSEHIDPEIATIWINGWPLRRW